MRETNQVSCDNRNVKLRGRTSSKVRDWVAAINDAGLRPPEGWCHPHHFGSFAPPRGLTEDGSEAQWFVDGQAAFGAIASAIEEAKSEIFITDWWLCPELYLRRPFDAHGSSRLGALMEAKAKQGVQEEVEMEDIMPKSVRDIDCGDSENPLAVVEYVEDICSFYKSSEN